MAHPDIWIYISPPSMAQCPSWENLIGVHGGTRIAVRLCKQLKDVGSLRPPAALGAVPSPCELSLVLAVCQPAACRFSFLFFLSWTCRVAWRAPVNGGPSKLENLRRVLQFAQRAGQNMTKPLQNERSAQHLAGSTLKWWVSEVLHLMQGQWKLKKIIWYQSSN
jgi:hypothetical protein